jgi:hypothetical protein
MALAEKEISDIRGKCESVRFQSKPNRMLFLWIGIMKKDKYRRRRRRK